MADVQGVIRERIAEIDFEKRQLEAVLAELTGERGTRRRGRPGTSTSRRTPKAKRAKPGERQKQVLAHLEKNPGARPTDIASAIETSPNQVHAVIAKLRKEKLVRKRGKGYGLARAATSPRSARSPKGPQGS